MPNPWKNLTKPDWLIEGSVAPSRDGSVLLQAFRTARWVPALPAACPDAAFKRGPQMAVRGHYLWYGSVKRAQPGGLGVATWHHPIPTGCLAVALDVSTT